MFTLADTSVSRQVLFALFLEFAHNHVWTIGVIPPYIRAVLAEETAAMVCIALVFITLKYPREVFARSLKVWLRDWLCVWGISLKSFHLSLLVLNRFLISDVL